MDGQSIQWARWLNTPKSGTTVKEARPLTVIGERMQKQVTEKQTVLLPLIAYYGTGRLWNQKKKTEKKVFESEFYSRTAGYQDCLDPASSYKFLRTGSATRQELIPICAINSGSVWGHGTSKWRRPIRP
jgi:predicted ATP-binding protein involved in virulence